MGKIILRNVEIQVDKQFERDLRRSFDIEADNLQDLKNTVNQLGNDVAVEFEVGVDKISMKGAAFSKNNFVVF